MEFYNWIARPSIWIVICAYIGCIHVGPSSAQLTGDSSEDAAIVSLSDLEQSETFQNIIQSVSVAPISSRDFQETIPISSFSAGDTIAGPAAVSKKQTSRRFAEKAARTSQKGPLKGRRRKKMRRRKISRKKGNNALSLRHEPDDDNDNNLTKIAEGDTASTKSWNQNGTEEGKRKVKRRRKENGPNKSVQDRLRQSPRNARQRRRRRKEKRQKSKEEDERGIWKQRNTTLKPGTAKFHSGAGDLSCTKGRFRQAPVVPHSEIKYSRNAANGHENAILEAIYVCLAGYELRGSAGPLLCSEGLWVGQLPECVRLEAVEMVQFNESFCPSTNGLCDQLCSVNRQSGEHECSCFKGFAMRDGGCRDIDECRENVCQFGKCINTIGSFRCYCPKGFRLDGIHCVDVNECLLRNKHGPCQDVCTNTEGAFVCSCENLAGTVLAADGQRCEFVDECEKDNGGCSHTCLTANGRAFCDCPEGWTLDPVSGKQCLDVDECLSSDCEFSCINTPGSYKCVKTDYYLVPADQPAIEEVLTCPPGFLLNYTTENCDDADECQVSNGGCFDVCTNTKGSFHCSCKDGYIFAADKFSCVVNNQSAGVQVTCPPLFPPRHGYLECTRNEIASEGGGRRRRVTNHSGTVCILKCPLGYHRQQKFTKICGSDGNWTGEDNGTCAKYPPPAIVCPKSVKMEVPANETRSTTTFRMPNPPKLLDKAALNWKISPGPMTGSAHGVPNDVIELQPGQYTVTYTGGLRRKSSCYFTVEIEDGSPPVVESCPSEQTLTVGNQYETVQVDWATPQFSDNVGLTSVTSSNLPGSYFGLGSHKITYTASDKAGYSAQCVFRILVRLPKWKYFNYLQLPRDI